MIRVSVIVGTFGDDSWKDKASKAIWSAEAQTVAPMQVIHAHCDSLHEARNKGAKEAQGDLLVFLDADDMLDPCYIEAMTEAYEKSVYRSNRRYFLYQPATLGVYPDGRTDSEAVVIPQRDLRTGNFMVIGTMMERKLFYMAGGFLDWPAWEDWELYLRCYGLGAGFIQVPDAIYQVGVNPDSRNQSAAGNRQLFKEILAFNDRWLALKEMEREA